MKTIETARLLLRQWRLEDASDMYEYAKLPTVGPAAGWTAHQSVLESEAIIRRFLQSDETWAIVLKNERKVIGSIGLHRRTDLEGNLASELGYVLSTPYEGNGYMTEACMAVLAFAFDDRQNPFVTVNHFVHNQKSRRVIEKCGFTLVGERDYVNHDGSVRPSLHYRLDQATYRQRRNK